MGISEKKINFLFFVFLDSSAGFLSAIFGILGKFRIDIGVQKKFRIFFRDEKIIKKSQHLDTFEALLNLYKELKHSLYKFYKGNASIPYINSKVSRCRVL